MSNSEKVNYIFLLSRDLLKSEKEELKKWFKVFAFTKQTVNGRTVLELLNDYDVLLLNIYDASHRQFYSESIKLLDTTKNIIRVFVGKLEDDKETKAEIIEQWHIDYFTKAIPTSKVESKEELLHRILCTLLTKPKQKSYKRLIIDAIFTALSYVLPKLFKS